MKKTFKKGVMSEVIGVFVLVLVIAVLAGMTFLFTSSLKTQVLTKQTSGVVYENLESGWLNTTGYTLATAGAEDYTPTIVAIVNATDGALIAAANYSISGNTLKNGTAVNNIARYHDVLINYTYTYTANYGSSYDAVNETEESGATIINYLPLLFLAIIFGVILAVVLKIILPYINLGNQVGGF
jgi:hypothetical protein